MVAEKEGIGGGSQPRFKSASLGSGRRERAALAVFVRKPPVTGDFGARKLVQIGARRILARKHPLRDLHMAATYCSRPFFAVTAAVRRKPAALPFIGRSMTTYYDIGILPYTSLTHRRPQAPPSVPEMHG